VAAQMTENTRGSWVQFQSVVESLSITFGNILLPGVTAAFNALAAGLSKVEALISAFPTASKVAIGLVTALVAMRVATIAGGYAFTFVTGAMLQVRAVILTLRTAWLIYTGAVNASTVASRSAIVVSRALAAAQWLLNAAFMASPIGLIITAITGLVAAGIWMWRNWEKVTAFFSWAWEKIKGRFASFSPVNLLQDAMAKLWNWLSSFSLFEMGANLLKTFTDGIISVVSAPVEAVKGALSKVRELLPFSDANTGPLSELTYSGMQV